MDVRDMQLSPPCAGASNGIICNSYGEADTERDGDLT